MVTSLRPKLGTPRSYHFPDFHDQILPSGIRLVTAQVAKLPVITVLVVVDAGSTNDPGGKEGVAALTAGTLLEGSRRFGGAELAEKFEQLGTSVESGADWDSAFIKITVLSEQLEEATKLLGEAISSPVFPEREVERAKAERLAELLVGLGGVLGVVERCKRIGVLVCHGTESGQLRRIIQMEAVDHVRIRLRC